MPVFDSQQFLEQLPNLPLEVKMKIQEFVTRGAIDDVHLLKVKSPQWEFLDTQQQQKEESKESQLLSNPAAIFIEGFRSVPQVLRHMDALSDE